MDRESLIAGFKKEASERSWNLSEANEFLKLALDDFDRTGVFNNISSGNEKPATPIDHTPDNNAVNQLLKEQQDLENIKARLYPK